MNIPSVSVSFLWEGIRFWCHQCRKRCTAGWLCSGYVPLLLSVVATSSVSLSPLDMGTSAVPKFGSVPSLLLLPWCSVWPRCLSALVPPVFGIKLSTALQWALLFRNRRLARVFIADFLFFKSFPPVPALTSLLLCLRCISGASVCCCGQIRLIQGVLEVNRASDGTVLYSLSYVLAGH